MAGTAFKKHRQSRKLLLSAGMLFVAGVTLATGVLFEKNVAALDGPLQLISIDNDTGLFTDDFVTNDNDGLIFHYEADSAPLPTDIIEFSPDDGVTWFIIPNTDFDGVNLQIDATDPLGIYFNSKGAVQTRVTNTITEEEYTSRDEVTIEPPVSPFMSNFSIMDDVAPEIGLVSDGGTTNDNTPLFTGACIVGPWKVVITITNDNNEKSVFEFDTWIFDEPGSYPPTTCPNDNTWSFTPPEALADGTYTVEMHQTNFVGNVSNTLSYTFTVLTNSPPVEPPVVPPTEPPVVPAPPNVGR